MKLFGNGRGFLGLPKHVNLWIRLIIIWIAFGGFAYYFFSKSNNILLGIVCIGLGILFTAIDFSR